MSDSQTMPNEAEATGLPQPGMVTRVFAPGLIDEEPQESNQANKPKRRRGRPPGSATRVVHAHVTADEFAVLRAVAQGVDIAAAARQYLLWPGRVPERPTLLKIYSDLLRRVEAGAQALPENKLARRMVRDLLSHQTVVLDGITSSDRDANAAYAATATTSSPRSSQTTTTSSSISVQDSGAAGTTPIGLDPATNMAASTAAAQSHGTTRKLNLPTLEEFAAQFDEDMYSEAELLELYEEEYLKTQTELVAPPTASAQNAQADSLTICQSPAQSPFSPTRTASTSALDAVSTADQPIESPGALATKSLAARIEIQLKAINWLDERLGSRPTREHHVDQWVRLNETQRQALREAGVISLGDLVDWMSLQGERWVDKVPGYGLTLPLFRVVLSPTITRPFYAVPRTSVARTASG